MQLTNIHCKDKTKIGNSKRKLMIFPWLGSRTLIWLSISLLTIHRYLLWQHKLSAQQTTIHFSSSNGFLLANKMLQTMNNFRNNTKSLRILFGDYTVQSTLRNNTNWCLHTTIGWRNSEN